MTSVPTKTNRTKLTFVMSMVVAAVFAFSLAACGAKNESSTSAVASTTEQSATAASSTGAATGGTTLQQLFEKDSSSKNALTSLAQQMADSFSNSSGMDCTTEVSCTDNHFDAIINASITKADLNGASLDSAFQGEDTVQAMAAGVADLEKQTGISGITFTLSLKGSDGELLGTATYNSTGLV